MIVVIIIYVKYIIKHVFFERIVNKLVYVMKVSFCYLICFCKR